jgi:hypothetical protein
MLRNLATVTTMEHYHLPRTKDCAGCSQVTDLPLPSPGSDYQDMCDFTHQAGHISLTQS